MSTSNIRSFTLWSFALVLTLVLCGGEFAAQAQNTNSSTTTNSNDSMMPQNDNANMSGNMNTNRRGRRGRRGRRPSNANTNANMSDDSMMQDSNMNANMNSNMSGDQPMQDSNMNANMSGETNSNMSTSPRGRRGRRGARRPPAETMPVTDSPTMTDSGSGAMTPGSQDMMAGTTGGVDADLSGTYTGTVNYPDGSISGEGTLTITGNQFTLEAGGQTVTGTVRGVNTRGYIGAAMRFGDALPATVSSVRVRKRGNRVTINSVRGETRQFSFTGRTSG